MKNTTKTLVVLAGPTAVGKTEIGIEIAKYFNTEIISADSRQFYQEMNIGTAKPDSQQLATIKHHFIGHLSIHNYYNVSRFEQDVLHTLENLFQHYNLVLLVGGSGLYIDAVCNGIDDFPDPAPELRAYLKGILADEGIEKLRQMLATADPEYYKTVDVNNHSRLLRALEVCMTSGSKFSELRTESKKQRDFRIVKIALNMPRQSLFARIAQRVDVMMDKGLLDEVFRLLPFRHLNALQTVGYKELFEYIDGNITLEQAIEDIKTHTRRYAKRQITWFNRNGDYTWFDPVEITKIIDFIEMRIS